MCLQIHPTGKPSTLPSVPLHSEPRNPTKVLVCPAECDNCLLAERRGLPSFP